MQLIIEAHCFKTKSAAEIYIRELLKNLCPFRKIFPADEHYGFLDALILGHQRLSTKGSPDYFLIQPNIGKNLELVWVKNDERDIFSYRMCFRDLKNNKLTGAMRHAIEDQLKIKEDPFCGICRLPLDGIVHVDHIKHFHKIRDEFLDQWQGEIPCEFNQSPQESHKVNFLLKDCRFKAAWQQWHKDHAKLRVVHAKCNMMRGRKEDSELHL